MYEGDSFFTLSVMGQVGLIVLSSALAIALTASVLRLVGGRVWPLRIGIAVLAFWAFLWLSPQIYYFYYMILIDGLPWQSVIKSPPGLRNTLSLLTFTEAANLSNYAKAGLGWAMIALAAWNRRPKA